MQIAILEERVAALEARLTGVEDQLSAVLQQLQEVLRSLPAEAPPLAEPAAEPAAAAAAPSVPRRRAGAPSLPGGPRYYAVTRSRGEPQLGIHLCTWAQLTALGGGRFKGWTCTGSDTRAEAEENWLTAGWEAPAPFFSHA